MILVDASIDIHRLVYGNLEFFDNTIPKPQNGRDEYKMFVHLFLMQVKYWMKKFKADRSNRIIYAFDSKSWRKKYFQSVREQYFKNYYKTKVVDEEGYKAHREKSDKIDWGRIYDMVDEIMFNLESYTDIIAFKSDSAEADDIIGTIVLNSPDEDITIISGDKDFKQLLTRKNIKLFDGRKHQYLTVDDVDLFLKTHIIMGDKSDEIPAIKERVGEKTAIKMLPTIDMLLETNLDMKYRYEINKTLIDLREIPTDISLAILRKYDNEKGQYKFDGIEFTEFLMKYNCRKLIENVNNFKLDTWTGQSDYVDTQNYSDGIIDNFFDEL